MVFLILESLGSTELVFILLMALVFFGPRKLPQIGRTLGKNLAEFRRASDDFKRTWNKEVSLEELGSSSNSFELSEHNSILGNETAEPVAASRIETSAPDSVIARQVPGSPPVPSYDQADSANEQSELGGATDAETKNSPRSEWL